MDGNSSTLLRNDGGDRDDDSQIHVRRVGGLAERETPYPYDSIDRQTVPEVPESKQKAQTHPVARPQIT